MISCRGEASDFRNHGRVSAIVASAGEAMEDEMVRLGKMAVAAAALGMATTPVIAAEGAASKLSLRASTAAEKDSDLAGGALVAAIGLAAFVVGGAILVGDVDDEPDSN